MELPSGHGFCLNFHDREALKMIMMIDRGDLQLVVGSGAGVVRLIYYTMTKPSSISSKL
jgi:hypothetical protein